MRQVIECKQCGGALRKRTWSRGNLTGIVLALIVLAIGLVPSATGLWFIGIPLAVLALFMGGKRIKVWKCSKCGAFFERA